jgi:acetyl-CoA acetyltransferase
MRSSYVLGVGMTPFYTPRNSPSYVELGAAAIRDALSDASIRFDDVEQVFASYVYGDSCSGHRAVYEVGLSAVPIFNVNSNCSSGSSAMFLARQAVASGALECALAVGFEQMPAGALAEYWPDRTSPLAQFIAIADRRLGAVEAPMALKLFSAAAQEYRERYGISPETFASITVKSRKHAAANPRAVFRDSLTVEQVLSSPLVCDPLTRLQCCPPTCGAAATVICSEAFAKRYGMSRAVRIAGQALVTDLPSSFAGSAIDAVGYRMAREAGRRAFEEAGVSPLDVDLAELHDCFTVNEVLAYEALGLCAEGYAAEFVASGANTYGGRCVTNPSGGLLSKGHPLGATGIAQCFELTNQLRGEADKARQVQGARLGVAHNMGLGGSCVVTVYEGIRA